MNDTTPSPLEDKQEPVYALTRKQKRMIQRELSKLPKEKHADWLRRHGFVLNKKNQS